jgi:hypothetical protein
MPYTFTEEEIYNRALYTIDNKGQDVYIVFEPSEGESYMMIAYCENGDVINGYHDTVFWDTLYDVLATFDNERRFNYEIVAV